MATQVDPIARLPGASGADESAEALGAVSHPGLRGDRAVILGVLATWGLALVLLTALDLDVASSRYLKNDLLFRGATSIESFHRQPVMDPSPHSIALPADLFLKGALAQAELPTWDRSQGGGYSPLAQGNLGMLFPVRWFAALFPTTQVQSVVLLTTLAACLAFSFLAIRRMGMGLQPACLGALVYSLSGFTIGQLLFDGVAVYLFLPWLVFAYLAFCDSPRASRLAHLVVAFGMSFTSGHLMLLASVYIGMAALALVHAAVREVSASTKLRDLFALAAASFWGALLAAPFLLPFVNNFRSAWKYKTQTAEGVSYEVADLAGWLARLRAMIVDEPGPFMDGPSFYLYLGVPALALAGLGVAVCWQKPQQRFIAPFFAAMFLFCVPGPWMAFVSDVPPITFIRTFYLYALFVFAVSLAVAAGLEWIRNHPAVPASDVMCWLVVVVLGAMFVARGSEHFQPVKGTVLPASQPYEFLQRDSEQYRVTGLWGQLHLPNIAHLTGIEDLRLLAVTMNRRYHAWFEIVDPGILGKNFPTARITEELSSPLIGAFNVKYVLEGKLPHHYFVTQLTPGDPFGAFEPRVTQLSSAHLTQRYEDGLIRIHEVTETYRPRAYFPDNVVAVEPGIESASAWLRAHPERHGDTVVVEIADPAFEGKLDAIDSSASRQVMVRYPSNAHVVLDVQTDTPGLLVLNDIFEAGWTARVDGAPREILATNLISRGIWLEAGESKVEMRYSPPGLVAGFGVAGIALTALLLWVLRSRSGVEP